MDWNTMALLLKLSALAAVDFYMTVFGIGCMIRFGWVSSAPAVLEGLAQPGVMTIAGLLYFLEHFAEKIPGVAVAWTWAHAFIKPLAICGFVAAVTFQLSVGLGVLTVCGALVISGILSVLDAKAWTILGLIPGLPVLVTLVEDVVIFVAVLKTIAPVVAAASR